MEWLLKRKLTKLGHKADPDKAFTDRLELLLMPGAKAKGFGLPAWKLAAVPALALILVVGTTGTYAYASTDVLPGNPLYAVKKGLEKVEEKTTVKPQTKLLVQIKHLERRLQEDKVLLNRNKKLPQARLKDFQVQLRSLMDQAGKLPEKQRMTLDHQLAKIASGYYTLQTDVTNAGLDAKERLEVDRLLDSSDKDIESRINSMDASRKSEFKAVEERIRAKK
ncbi:MAG: DUF5667 domain-containing protein [Patescibacteria group bacterium]